MRPALLLKKLLIIPLLAICINGYAQVTADFVPSTVTSCSPATISYTNTSIGPVKSSYWHLGNGTISNFTDASSIYVTPGIYTVTLTVTDHFGATDSKSEQIEIYANPKVQITSDVTSVCERDEVSFTDASILGDTTTAVWLWDFGDGSVSYNENPKYTYQNSGQYTVRLVLADHNGCNADTTLTNYMRVKEKAEPQFSFNTTRVCKPPVSVSFNNATAISGNTFLWQFSDGTTSSAVSPTKSFTSAGSHSVKLIATNVSGCVDSILIRDSILIAPLSVDFSIPSTSLCDGDEIVFTQNCYPVLTTPTIYKWTFPDGSVKYGKSVMNAMPSGNQNVTLKVVNDQCQKSFTKAVQVNPPPTKSIYTSENVLCGSEQPLSFSFENTGIDSFMWLLDGKEKEGRSNYRVSNFIVLDEEGGHFLELYIRDTNNCEIILRDTVYQSIPVLTLSADTGGCIPYTAKSSLAVSAKYKIDSAIWDLGALGQGRYSGYDPPAVILSDTGVYIVDLLVYDSLGCIFSKSRVIEGGYVPIATFSVDTNVLCNRQSNILTSTSRSPYVPTEYFWSVGVKSATTQIWESTFSLVPGIYPILHSVSHYGCWDDADQLDSIQILGPFINFKVSSDGCFDAYKTIITDLHEVDSFTYFLNEEVLGSDTLFQINLTDGDTLKVIATNESTGCMDSVIRLISVNGEALLDWSVSAGTCAPALIEIERFVEGVDSFKWMYEGNLVAHQEEIFRSTANSGGDISISLIGYIGASCMLQLDTVIRVAGPRVKALVGRSFGCFPVDLRLIDSFWNDTLSDRVWVIDGDTIPSDTLETEYQVKGLKDTKNNLLVVKMIAAQNGCFSSSQFNYGNSTIKFETSHTDTVSSCTTANYTFRFDVDASQKKDVKSYSLEYKGAVIQSVENLLSQVLVLDGSLDTVYLSVESLSGCLATQKVVIQKGLPTLNAKFTAGNTQAACPPLMVNFKDVSASKLGTIISTEWQINREEFSFLQNPSRIFSEPGAYSVQLKVTDDQGCVDSLNIDSFVTLLGEKVVVDFGLSMLCEDQKNTFKVKDGNASSYEWDMGDGTVLTGDSVEYTYADIGLYQMRLLVSDVSCKYPIQNAVMTEVVRKPVSDFEWTKSCPNQVADFISLAFTSTPINNLRWDIGGTEYVNMDTVPYLIGSSDELTKLVVTDSLGCQDSITKNVKIYPITVNFSLDKEFYCLGDSIRISPQMVTDTNVLSVFTYFDNVLESADNDPVIAAGIEGYFDVKVIATNEANCSDTISKTTVLKVAGPSTLSNAAISYISVGDDNEIFINWEKDTTGLFEKYELRDASSTVLWETNTGATESVTLTGLNPEKGAVCLMLQVENGCNTPPSFLTHCTVHTTRESISMARKVNWTPYVGWDVVDGYSIYREGDTGYELIGSVAGSDFSYVDSVHVNCDEVQKYKVAAYGPHISYSDTCNVKPVWDYSIAAPKFRNISVIDDESIELKIFDYQGRLPLQTVSLVRQNNQGSASNLDLGNTVYSIDEAVDVHSGRYVYTAQFIDECGSQSPASSPVNSIFLSVSSDVNTNYPKLVWSQTKIWEAGVKYYIIFKQDSDGVFNEVGRTYSISDTTYLDNSSDIECSTSSCYVVQAYDNDNSEVSKSNSSCSGLQSRLYAPNAMTPNGDGVNDSYSPRGLYIARYHMEIYSRWGEKIFETDKCMQPWDGTVKDKKASEGAYFYIINATGADGVRHNLSGTITVLK
jgi:gliding motility-associated-like protein